MLQPTPLAYITQALSATQLLSIVIIQSDILLLSIIITLDGNGYKTLVLAVVVSCIKVAVSAQKLLLPI